MVRAIFGQPEHAADELRCVLPADLARAIDFTTLTACSGSFVDDALRERHADLLFETKLHGGGDALVYVLLEHQSSFDPWLPLRLLDYQVRIWRRWRTEHPDATKLPPIVPVVLHHGERAWRGSRRFSDLVQIAAGDGNTTEEPVSAAFRRHLVDFEFLLDDLATQSDESMLARAMSATGRLALLALKHARTSEDLESRLLRWIDLVVEMLRARDGGAALRLIQRYIFEVSAYVRTEFFEQPLAAHLPPEFKESIVPTGLQLMEQSRQEGVLQGRAESLVRLLAHRFGTLPDDIQQKIDAATAIQLDEWIVRVLTAPSLAEVFAA